MSIELYNFIEENCKKCKETCEKGIVQTSEMIRCVDKNIYHIKNEIDNFQIRRLLMKIGISANLQGFIYILSAWEFIKKQSIHTNITTIYEYIEKKDNAKSKFEVERAIKNSINTAYKTNKKFKKFYGSKPSNKMFIYDLVFNQDIFEYFLK